MMGFCRGLVGVLAVGLAASGCTTLLGDFSSSSAIQKDGGTGADATAGDDTGADASLSGDDAGSGEAGGDDAASAPDSAGGCAPGQLHCAAGCVSPNDVLTCGDCNNDCTTLPHVAPGASS